MKQVTNIRKAVCTMANELKKEGYTLSQAFRKAWKRIKLSMRIRAMGVTAGNIQERLGIHETVSSKYHAGRACKRAGKPI